MRRLVEIFLVVATCCLLVACSTYRVQNDLAQRFVELQDEGKLPGLAPGVDAEIHMQHGGKFDRVTYPCLRDVFVMRADNPSCYTYRFVKDSPDSQWQLTKAWVMTQDGERSELKVP